MVTAKSFACVARGGGKQSNQVRLINLQENIIIVKINPTYMYSTLKSGWATAPFPPPICV